MYSFQPGLGVQLMLSDVTSMILFNISRAQAGGTLRPDVPPHVAIDLLVGPLFCRMFVQHEPVTDTFVKQVLRYVVEGLQPRAVATRGRGR